MKKLLITAFLLFLISPCLVAQVPEPEEFFGFSPGDNYKLIDSEQLEEYYRAVADASEFVQLREIGTTHRERPLLLLTISSKENLDNLDDYRSISERLARVDNLTDQEAQNLAKEGKAVVWIDSGMHSPELAHSQHNPEFVYYMVTDDSEETQSMRDEVILLNMPLMNPDGHDIVVNWYREQQETEFALTGPPVVYHEYVGHDNNRDWYMLLQNESQAVAEVLYNEWYPQIVLNHHQMGEMPPRMFIPPFDDPVNPNIPAMAVRGTNLVGEHMGNRFAAEGKSGIIQGITFNMWWNGGMRTVPYFHNMIGILTESTHRSPIPKQWDEEDIPDTIVRGSKEIPMKEPSIFYPDPWEGGEASLKQMVDYHLTASLGVMDIAVKRKQDWLYNIYQMGRDAIRSAEEQPPYAYVVGPDQWDPAEAIEMLKVLKRGGLDVHRATSDFSVEGEEYSEGSYLLFSGQAFRPFLTDLMEPQQYPDRRLYPDGPPEAPYDMAGWTLPIQMGVNVARIQEPVDIGSEEANQIEPFASSVVGSGGGGFLLPSTTNMADMFVSKMLTNGHSVYRLAEPVTVRNRDFEAGAYFVESSGEGITSHVRQFISEYGISVTGVDELPGVESTRIHPPNIAMYQSWTANMDEGWTRWIFDNYGFNYSTLHDEEMRNGDFSDCDIIILPSMSSNDILRGNDPGQMPLEYVGGIGLEGALNLKKYVENGGTVIGWEGAADFMIQQFGLPVRNSLEGVAEEDFFIPGSLLRLNTDNSTPYSYGIQPEHAGFFVRQSVAFSVLQPAEAEDRKGAGPQIEVISSYAEDDILMSGWALGEDEHLSGKPAALRVGLGEGEVILIGFRPQLRAQPRATFKFLFNAIFASSSEKLPEIQEWQPSVD